MMKMMMMKKMKMIKRIKMTKKMKKMEMEMSGDKSYLVIKVIWRQFLSSDKSY